MIENVSDNVGDYLQYLIILKKIKKNFNHKEHFEKKKYGGN